MREAELETLNDRDLVAELIQQISASNASVSRVEEGVLELMSWEGVDLDPAVRLHIDRDQLNAHLSSPAMRQSVESLWPGSPAIEGGLTLLTIHIQEMMDTKQPHQVDLELDPASATVRWVQAAQRRPSGLPPRLTVHTPTSDET